MIVIKLLRPRGGPDDHLQMSVEHMLMQAASQAVGHFAGPFYLAAAIVHVADNISPEEMELAILDGEQKVLAGMEREKPNV